LATPVNARKFIQDGAIAKKTNLDERINVIHNISPSFWRPRHCAADQNHRERQPMASYLDRLFGLNGRVALVTGSSGGIGCALARGMAEAGAIAVINGRAKDKVEGVVAQIEASGGKAHGAVFDVTDSAQVRAGVARIEAEIGPIDILVNNAGIQRRTPLEDFPEETWRELMKANLDSVFFVGQAVARAMIPRKRGRIINICSVQSELGRPSIAPYTASKGAVKMLTKGMAIDWGKHGIRVNGLGPGYFRTELNQALVEDEEFSAWLTGRTPLGRWGEVEELVGAAIFLASEASSFLNGHIVYVDGGITASI
jgi:gluconate 5-dehydrogenase